MPGIEAHGDDGETLPPQRLLGYFHGLGQALNDQGAGLGAGGEDERYDQGLAPEAGQLNDPIIFVEEVVVAQATADCRLAPRDRRFRVERQIRG